MYQSFDTSDAQFVGMFQRRHDPALYHGGRSDHLLRRHERHAALAAAGRDPDVPPVGPYLLRRLADARTMMCACQDLLRRGPRAPGPNGHRLEALERAELWSLCRALAGAIRAGRYRPGGDRRVKIPRDERPEKSRTLTIRDAEDRVVGRATLRVLQPVLEPGFSPFSFGGRPGRGAQSALATALALAEAQQRWTWIVDDVAGAFDHIPFNRLLDACHMKFPPEMVRFLALIASTGGRRGVRQGSPESPLLANLFYDHFLDWPWQARDAAPVLFRYIDDLLLLCESHADAVEQYAALSARLRSIGTPLKGSAHTSVHDLSVGATVDWLGYRIALERGSPTVRIAPKAFDRLAARLAKAHLVPAAPLRAEHAVLGWLGYLGPCFPFEDREAVLQRVREVAAAQAFDEIPAVDRLIGVWSAAHARWCRLRRLQEQLLPSRLRALHEQMARRSAAHI